MKLLEVHYDENEVYITFKKGYNNLYPPTQVKVLREAIEEIHCYIAVPEEPKRYVWIDTQGHISPKIMTEKEAEQTVYIHKYMEPK